jgi:hypothetical protein
MKKITSIDELIKECNAGNHEYFISNGIVKSSKYIHYDTDTKIFSITNEIDNSEQELTAEQLNDESITFIGYAIKNNRLFMY